MKDSSMWQRCLSAARRSADRIVNLFGGVHAKKKAQAVPPEHLITFYDFAEAHPDCVRDNKITCPHCGAVEEVSMDKRMDIDCGTLNDHVCRNCGAVLYHSVCSFRR